jgi:hypothetical protein
MVLFVLYIEPLIQAIDNNLAGVEIGQTTVKTLAYIMRTTCATLLGEMQNRTKYF